MPVLCWLNKSETDKISRTHSKAVRRPRYALQRPTCTGTQDYTAFPTMQRLLMRPFLSDEHPQIRQVLTSNSSAILGPSRKSLVLRQSTGPKLAATPQTRHFKPLFTTKPTWSQSFSSATMPAIVNSGPYWSHWEISLVHVWCLSHSAIAWPANMAWCRGDIQTQLVTDVIVFIWQTAFSLNIPANKDLYKSRWPRPPRHCLLFCCLSCRFTDVSCVVTTSGFDCAHSLSFTFDCFPVSIPMNCQITIVWTL